MANKTIDRIKELRNAIRYHRDQKGDNRCWLDDNKLWALTDNGESELKKLPSFEETMRRCRDFYIYRRADVPDPMPPGAKLDPQTWDEDLLQMSGEELEQEYSKLEQAIQMHRAVSDRPLTLDDDRKLYSILPERLPADFRLPPETDFLGEARAPHAGCPSFWRSHQSCSCAEHDTHRWGPCCST